MYAAIYKVWIRHVKLIDAEWRIHTARKKATIRSDNHDNGLSLVQGQVNIWTYFDILSIRPYKT